MSEQQNEEQLGQIIADFLRQAQQGDSPDRAALLAANPQFAEELQSFFANHDAMHREEASLPELDATGEFSSREGWPEDSLGASFDSAGSSGISDVADRRVRYFGDYELLEEVARGGMGVVFKARQTTLGRIVALKMILAGRLAGEDDVQRFRAEAQAAAKLDHPNIVPIFEVGEHEGRQYFSMGFVHGISLAERVAEGPLPPREAAEVIRVVSEAIAYAHRRGVIHRDLKPGNILLAVPEAPPAEPNEHPLNIQAETLRPGSTHKGERAGAGAAIEYTPKVVDFGLAKRVEEQEGVTVTGLILGTPAYMPPEQATGHAKEITRAADIYSLGAVLYCLLTGRPPFQAATPLETLRQVVESDPIPLRRINPAVPRDLETITLKCLASRPEQRYASAEALAEELGRYQRGEPILARPVSAAERLWRWRRRNPVTANSLAAALLLLLILGIGGPLVAVQQARLTHQVKESNEQLDVALEEKGDALERLADAFEKETAAKERLELALTNETEAKQQAEAARAEEHKQRTVAEHRTKLAERRLYASQIARVRMYLAAGQRQEAELALAQIPAEHRGWEANHLDLQLTGTPLVIRGVIIKALVCSRKGNVVAGIDRVVSTQHSPAGIHLWNMNTGDTLLRIPETNINCLAFSPDGRRIAAGGDEGKLKIWDAATGELLKEFENIETDFDAIAFTPDGVRIVGARFLYSRSGVRRVKVNPSLAVWEVESGEQIWQVEPEKAIESLSLNPDGGVLATAGSKVQLWDAATGELIHEPVAAKHVAFSPAGDKIAISGYDDASVWSYPQWKRLWMHEADDQERVRSTIRGEQEVETGFIEPREERLGPAPIDSLQFSPDGRNIVYSNGHSVLVREAASGESVAKFPHALVADATFSFDGTQVISGGRDLRMWNLEHPDQVHRFLHLPFSKGSPYLSGDGSRMISHTKEGAFEVVDTRTGAVIHTLRPETRPPVEPGGGDAVDRLEATRRLVRRFGKPDALLNFEGSQAATFEGSVVTLWDVGEGKVLRTLDTGQGEVVAAELAKSRPLLATRGTNQTLKFWNTETGELISSTPHLESWGPFALAPNGEHYAVALKVTCEVRTIATHEKLAPEGYTFSGEVGALAFSPDSTHVACGGPLIGDIHIFNVATSERMLAFPGHPQGMRELMFSPDGRRLLSASRNATLKLWDVFSGEETFLLESHSNLPQNLRFSPDGARILADGAALGIGGRGIDMWESAGAYDFLFSVSGDYERGNMALSPDGSLIAYQTSSRRVKIAQLPEGEVLAEPPLMKGTIQRLAFSADGRKIVAETEDLVTTCDARTGAKLFERNRWEGVFEEEVGETSGAGEELTIVREVLHTQVYRRNRENDPWSRNAEHHPEAARRWHEARAEEAASEQQWFTAEFHWQAVGNRIRDRAAARLVLERGGMVRVHRNARERFSGEWLEVASLDALPEAPFDLFVFFLDPAAELTDEDLKAFHNLPALRAITLCGPGVTDAGVHDLLQTVDLTTLRLYNTSVTGAGLTPLKGHTDFSQLYTGYSTRITDEGLAAFSPLPVTSLTLFAGGLTERGIETLVQNQDVFRLHIHWGALDAPALAHLQELPRLRYLLLDHLELHDEDIAPLGKISTLSDLRLDSNPELSDACLPSLYGLTGLRNLNLRGTGVTAAGVEHLKEKLPECNVQFDDSP